jgi:hypothetical protein
MNGQRSYSSPDACECRSSGEWLNVAESRRILLMKVAGATAHFLLVLKAFQR